MCQVITPLLKSEWEKAAQSPESCWGSTMFIRAEGIIQRMAAQVLARASDKAEFYVSLQVDRAASAKSFTVQ